MNKAFRILLAVLLVQLSLQASAQEKKDLFNPVNYAVVSQTIAPDARGGGLGDVGAATDPDVNSQYWNPAKYPFCISCRSGAQLYTLASLVGQRYEPCLFGRLLPHWRPQRRVEFVALFQSG